ncbi:hypothetical protein GB881_02840 [Georgenia subflava]|uniref:Uncharacterized protein n=2 Tax=Georgenia subflava TaxID=1622177 RepID=A0A6N7EL54_9MICO|nr:hypothetical protein [Georgenia subflava]
MGGFALLGLVAIIAGGFVAAVTGPTGFTEGSWVAAYLVLVAGVAQLCLGMGQALLAAVPPSKRRRGWQLVLYNVANVAVLFGTLSGSVAVVVAGGALLLVALALFLAAVRRPRTQPPHTHSWYLTLYRILLVILGVSVPAGVVLSVLRHG